MENHRGRYVIGLEKVEQIPENGGHSATIRLTFYLEIPDAKNPQDEKWELRFCCNLYENPESIDLVSWRLSHAISASLRSRFL